MQNDPVPPLPLYGAAFAVAIASAALGLPAVLHAHHAGPETSTGLVLLTSLAATTPALVAGWLLPSRWAAAVAGATGVSCASFFTTAPALDVALVGPMFQAAASPGDTQAMAQALATAVQGMLLGGLAFAWFVAGAGAALGSVAAWKRGAGAGRLTTTHPPTMAMITVALSAAAIAGATDVLAGSMERLPIRGIRAGMGLHLMLCGAFAGALGAYLIRGARGPGRAFLALVGAGCAGVSVAATGLVAVAWLPWLVAGWLTGFAGGWFTMGEREPPADELRHAVGEALGAGLTLPFVLAISCVGVGLGVGLGPLQLIAAASGDGVADLDRVARDVLYARHLAWPVLFAGVGAVCVATPIRWGAKRLGA